jgi:hypothetical protein
MLADQSSLKAEFFIPNAAAKIKLTADLMRKVVSVSMKLPAPKDTKRATASINWLTRQFKGKNVEGLSVVAHWPGRTPTTMNSLEKILENPAVLIPAGSSALPNQFEVITTMDLGARFKGAKTFAEDVLETLPRYYQNAGQYLKGWVARPPKMLEKTVEEIDMPEAEQMRSNLY